MSASSMVQAPDSASLEMSDREWDKLVNLIVDGYVVPVLGPELLVVPENGRPTPLYDIWGRALAAQSKIEHPEGAHRWTVYDVANLLSQRENPADLAYDMDYVVRKGPWPVPESLRNLAGILDLSLYVTTTVDHLLMKAMAEARPGANIEQIKFTPKGKKEEVDLPTQFTYGARLPGVFHLFGASGPTDGTFAKTEDDLIEWSWSLLDRGSYAPNCLYDYLQKKTVLLLGCSMPDWLGRFFIHALNGCSNQETINMYYVSLNCEPGLTEYLNRRRAKVITDIPPVDFAAKLFACWQARRQASATGAQPALVPVATEFKSGAVFLSYFSEDRAAVRAIRDQLEAKNIDTWLDEQELPDDPGNYYEEKIRDNIRDAAFFVPIISRNWERAGPKRFVRREWRMAEDAAKERRREDFYLQPLVIDDTPPGSRSVDELFRDVQWTRLRDGLVPPAFIDTLSAGIRNFRRMQ